MSKKVGRLEKQFRVVVAKRLKAEGKVPKEVITFTKLLVKEYDVGMAFALTDGERFKKVFEEVYD